MENKPNQQPMNAQQQDAIQAMIIAAVITGLLYYFIFNSFFTDLLHLSITTQIIILALCWMMCSGMLIGIFMQQRAFRRMAYEK